MDPTKLGNNIYIYYGSELGNTKKIATTLYNKIKNIICINKKYNVILDSLDNFIPTNDNMIVFILISTTGDGEFPKNSLKFYKFLRKTKKLNLDKLNISIVGFGDSNYRSFCYPSKYIYRKFKKYNCNNIFDVKYIDMVEGNTAINNMIKKRTIFIKKLIYLNKQNWLSKILGFNNIV